MSEPLRIAVLGDVHGHLTLAFRILRRWQDETGVELDLILQVGDLGAFPPPFRLDDATRRFAERDPDELGFAVYHGGGAEAAEVFGPAALPHRALAAEMWFIKGNHEDFVFLDEVGAGATEPVPVDAFGGVRYLPSGRVYELARRDRSVRIGVLGGISDRGRPGADPVSEFYTAQEARALRRASFDMLLTHEPPLGAAGTIHQKYENGGSPEGAELLRACRPVLHFCGHLHEPGQQIEGPEGVRSYELHAVNFARADKLNKGCIAFVEWYDRDDARVSFLDSAEPWLRTYTRHTWRHV